MRITVLAYSDSSEISKFIDGHNVAFKNRSSARCPYVPLTLNDLSCDNIVLGLYNESNVMVGGLCLFTCVENAKRVGKISHVWTMPNAQNRGIAKAGMLEAERIAEESQIDYLQLNVADIVQPAVQLYKRLGYKAISVYANTPGTYRFIRMVKNKHGKPCGEITRHTRLIVSKIKFFMLYHRDSTPKLLCRILYRSTVEEKCKGY